MKKIFMLLAVTGSVMMATAQTVVKFGVKAGVNAANIGGQDVEGNKLKPGFHLGAFAEIPVATSFTVQPELLFSNQGAKSDEGGEKGTLNLNYLTIPIMAKYSFAESFYAETGPQVGFLLSAKAKQGSEKTNMKDDYKGVDVSWGLGVGYLFKSNIGVNARFNFGLSKLGKEGDFKAYNRVLQVGLTYVFGDKTFFN